MSDSTDRHEQILVPIDGSPQADQALDYALNMPDVAITVLTVINPFDIDPEKPGYQSPSGRAGMPGYSEEWYESVKSEVENLHEHARKRATDRDIPFKSETNFGLAARKIVKYAEEHDIDHIIMGTHGRSDPTRILLGSGSETVARRSPVTVTIVR
jgi:nucleotide-binding universal stress UspA family protein